VQQAFPIGRSSHAQFGTVSCAVPRGALAVVASPPKCGHCAGCNHFSAIPHALFKAPVFDFLDGEMG
jgi:hypothetical protein